MSKNNMRDAHIATPSDKSRAAMIEFFESYKPETAVGRVLKELRLKALRNGQDLSSWEDVQQELGREATGK